VDRAQRDRIIILTGQRSLRNACILVSPPIPQAQKAAERQMAVIVEESLESLDVRQSLG